VRIGQEYARRARLELDIDEPSIETLQTLLLLSQASFQLGKGKKTLMLLSMHMVLPTICQANMKPLQILPSAWLLRSAYTANYPTPSRSHLPNVKADDASSGPATSWIASLQPAPSAPPWFPMNRLYCDCRAGSCTRAPC